MSFASETKQELVGIDSGECCQIAELSALFHINGLITLSNMGLKIDFQTSSLSIARNVVKLVKNLYKVEVEIITKKQMKLNKNNIYIIRISSKTNQIINELALMNSSDGIIHGIDENLILKDCCKKAYMRGAFLASGSINNPNTTSYHLEIFSHSLEHAKSLSNLMNTFELNSKVSSKKRGYITYVKESEKISDFLKVVGAYSALFKYEDIRIKRDFVNSITRVMNCDIANQKKTIDAAKKQLKYIDIIERTTDVSKLSNNLNQAIFLRKEYPESSLSELSTLSIEHFNINISKSALNHRFRSIKELAESFSKGNEK